MARRKKPKHRTITFAAVEGGDGRERAFPLARQALEAAQSGLCREAAIFIDHARKVGGGPITENAAAAVKACRIGRPSRLNGLGSDTYYVDPYTTSRRTDPMRMNTTEIDRRRLLGRRTERSTIAREIIEDRRANAHDAAEAQHAADVRAAQESAAYYASSPWLSAEERAVMARHDAREAAETARRLRRAGGREPFNPALPYRPRLRRR